MECGDTVVPEEISKTVQESINSKGPRQILCPKSNCKHVLTNQEIINVVGKSAYLAYIENYNVNLHIE